MYFFEISVIICVLMYFILEIIDKTRKGSLIYNISGLHSTEPFVVLSGGINAGSLEFQAGKKKKEDENNDEKDDDDIDENDIDDEWDDEWDDEEDFDDDDDDDDEEYEEESWEEEIIKSENKRGELC